MCMWSVDHVQPERCYVILMCLNTDLSLVQVERGNSFLFSPFFFLLLGNDLYVQAIMRTVCANC